MKLAAEIFLIDVGSIVGFTIQREFIEKHNLNLNDLLEIEIFKEFEGKLSFTKSFPLRNIGGSVGVTFKTKLTEFFKFKSGEPLQIDIKIPTSQ